MPALPLWGGVMRVFAYVVADEMVHQLYEATDFLGAHVAQAKLNERGHYGERACVCVECGVSSWGLIGGGAGAVAALPPQPSSWTPKW